LYFPAFGLNEKQSAKNDLIKNDALSISAEGGKLVFQKGCSPSIEPAADAVNEGAGLILLIKN
jgi:hypothetical protein